MTATTKQIRAEVFARAKGKCECGCGLPIGDGHWDHFFGRSRGPESLSTTWALRIDHDEAKTQNRPSAAYWLQRFGEHCKRYGYLPELERARAKYLVLKARGFV